MGEVTLLLLVVRRTSHQTAVVIESHFISLSKVKPFLIFFPTRFHKYTVMVVMCLITKQIFTSLMFPLVLVEYYFLWSELKKKGPTNGVPLTLMINNSRSTNKKLITNKFLLAQKYLL